VLIARFDAPARLFAHRLASALTMERDSADMLDAFADAARSQELKHLLREHEGETGRQIFRIERAFAMLGIPPEDQPCPPIEAIDAEARAQIKRADDALVDDVILAAATAAAHHEIAAYDWLIAQADGLGARAVAALLRASRAEERWALAEIRRRITVKAHVPVRPLIARSATRRVLKR
jgi:ferritin-like metal-binding protein YciE